ncbi:MAG TPA: DegV family protein [Anaerolineae bacterium]|nr:DegV family protein [Anaerolineae bacterium]
MPRVAVVTDSCASIPESLIQALGIHWVPYYIHRGREVLRDLVTVQCDSFYRWLPTAEELPMTASPGPGDYLEVYQSLAEEQGAKEIISIHMTSKGSGAYQAAKVAQSALREEMPDLRIEVIDTLNVSMCQGWMVIEAARAALEDSSLSDIVDRVKAMIPTTRMIQTADTLRYLYMGGRIGKAKHLVGSLLRIKPLISMEQGVIVPLGQARSRRKAYEMMADMVESAVGAETRIKVAYVHAAAQEEAEKIRSLVEGRLNCVESLFAELSPALGVHTGPGTAGLCYCPAVA